ncbi:hypothetical protein I7I53_04322 [Histoplasma capsulatum var. duboisii H88]|uniref:Uncharacterized protein n=1 Tax=Ajellomyces capsulatus (strain H88) TaxID=544711 RepID=A0A8A1LPG3_AJEC8|nr:hypothetical protein I7I53_04322 [Histoplasma capsulatum var. duboisii H88]
MITRGVYLMRRAIGMTGQLITSFIRYYIIDSCLPSFQHLIIPSNGPWSVCSPHKKESEEGAARQRSVGTKYNTTPQKTKKKGGLKEGLLWLWLWLDPSTIHANRDAR